MKKIKLPLVIAISAILLGSAGVAGYAASTIFW